MPRRDYQQQQNLLERLLSSLHIPDRAHDERPSVEYQAMLRVIGAVLDDMMASDVAIIEGIRGFSVRYTRDGIVEARDLSYADLLSAYGAQQRDRKLLGTPQQGHYQDLLRAIGYELEHAFARSVFLAEAADNVVLSFQTSSPGAFRTVKHAAVLTPPLLDEVLAQARSRRRTSEWWRIRAAKSARPTTSTRGRHLEQYRDAAGARRMVTEALTAREM